MKYSRTTIEGYNLISNILTTDESTLPLQLSFQKQTVSIIKTANNTITPLIFALSWIYYLMLQIYFPPVNPFVRSTTNYMKNVIFGSKSQSMEPRNKEQIVNENQTTKNIDTSTKIETNTHDELSTIIMAQKKHPNVVLCYSYITCNNYVELLLQWKFRAFN